jgi:hypothetical protein
MRLDALFVPPAFSRPAQLESIVPNLLCCHPVTIMPLAFVFEIANHLFAIFYPLFDLDHSTSLTLIFEQRFFEQVTFASQLCSYLVANFLIGVN